MGKDRRQQVIQILTDSDHPVSGSSIAKQLKVSRQVIVQDIALLRANGADIMSTNSGYLLQQDKRAERVYKVLHSEEETQEELNLMVDLGGCVKDVFVYHKAYGVIRARLNLKSRKQIQDYVETLNSGKSTLLMNVTSGYHYHTVSADSDEILDQIFEALGQRGFLAPLQDYEPIDFWEKE